MIVSESGKSKVITVDHILVVILIVTIINRIIIHVKWHPFRCGDVAERNDFQI
jgi:hypothetical protein